MTDSPVTEYYIRPEDIRAEITLKRYKDKDYFMYFGIGLVITTFLCLIPFISNIFFVIAFLICLAGTGFFLLMIILSGDSYHPFWDTDKILITATGLALQDYQGKVKYLMPFAKVTGIRYGYSENIASVALDLRARVPLFVRFNLIDGKNFTIPMNYIVEEEQKKIFAYLPVGWG
jgi:hypothetical protein